MNKAEAEAAVAKYGSQRRACAELRISDKTIRRALAGEETSAKPVAAVSEDRTTAFRKLFDKSYIIPEKVNAVVNGWLQRVDWATDAEMQKQCGVTNPATWKTYARENAKFQHLRFAAPGGIIIWAKNKKHRDHLLERAMA